MSDDPQVVGDIFFGMIFLLTTYLVIRLRGKGVAWSALFSWLIIGLFFAIAQVLDGGKGHWGPPLVQFIMFGGLSSIIFTVYALVLWMVVEICRAFKRE